MTSVLFVCLGNICRSPLAEGVFRRHVELASLDKSIHIDSAGTGSWHIGHAPDPRSIAVALENGLDISHQRARRVEGKDFEKFEYIIAMDNENFANLTRLDHTDVANISLFLSHAPDLDVVEVPDPYYGGDDGFDHVYGLVDEAAKGLLKKILAEKGDSL